MTQMDARIAELVARLTALKRERAKIVAEIDTQQSEDRPLVAIFARAKEAILDPGWPLNLPVILLARRYRQSGGPGPPLGRKRGDNKHF